jgi:hypothetical protein
MGWTGTGVSVDEGGDEKFVIVNNTYHFLLHWQCTKHAALVSASFDTRRGTSFLMPQHPGWGSESAQIVLPIFTVTRLTREDCLCNPSLVFTCGEIE